MHCLPLPSVDRPRVVGIDDWAIRKGRTYGTLVVDPERSRPIDLLPNRSGVTVADWLRRPSGTQIVARDRVRPNSHCGRARCASGRRPRPLLLDIRQALERWLGRVHGRLRQLPALSSGDGRQPGGRLRADRRASFALRRRRVLLAA